MGRLTTLFLFPAANVVMEGDETLRAVWYMALLSTRHSEERAKTTAG